jgi:hypothetical protein
MARGMSRIAALRPGFEAPPPHCNDLAGDAGIDILPGIAFVVRYDVSPFAFVPHDTKEDG